METACSSNKKASVYVSALSQSPVSNQESFTAAFGLYYRRNSEKTCTGDRALAGQVQVSWRILNKFFALVEKTHGLSQHITNDSLPQISAQSSLALSLSIH